MTNALKLATFNHRMEEEMWCYETTLLIYAPEWLDGSWEVEYDLSYKLELVCIDHTEF